MSMRDMLVTFTYKKIGFKLAREYACKFKFIVEASCLFYFAFCFPATVLSVRAN